jgi:Zn-dependent protease with chaperone function
VDVFGEARAHLPAWVGWGTLAVHAGAAFILSAAGTLVAAAIASLPLRRLKETHWTQRARLVFPVRVAAMMGIIIFPLFFGAASLLYDGPLALLGWMQLGAAAAAAALAGAVWVRTYVDRRLAKSPATLLYGLQGTAAVMLILLPHFLVAVVMFAFLPDRVDLRAVVVLAAGGTAFVLCALGGGLAVARALGLARPASQRLARIVERAAEKAGFRPRGVYEIRWNRANAFAFPLIGRLAFTDRLLGTIGDAEIEAIAAHELGHLSEPRRVALTRMAGVFILLPLAAGRTIVGEAGLLPFVAAVFLVVLGVLLLRRLGRRMEERADAFARSREGEAGIYARALEAIYEANMIPAVLSGKRRVHPHLYDRLLAAGVQPAYPRPAPPPGWPARVGGIAAVLVVGIAVLGLRVGLLLGSFAAGGSETVLQAVIGATGGEARDVAALADLRYARGDCGGAIALYEAAVVMDGLEARYPARLAVVLAGCGRCREAKDYVEMARWRLAEGGGLYADRALITQAEASAARCGPRGP